MAEFSIQDAAFTGFGVVRAHPKALGYWALYALGLAVIFAVIIVGMMGPDFTKLTAVSASSTKDPAEILALFARLAPGYLVMMIAGVVSNSVLGAAMLRAVLQPADDRFGFLRLGADEMRQLGLGLLTFAVFMGVYFGLAIALGIVLGIIAAVAKATPAAGVFLIIAGVGGAMLFLAVRLSLAPALTFDRGRIDLWGSWALTRGRFWPLLGTYLLTSALIFVVYVLSLLVIFAIGAVATGGNPMAVRPDMTSLQSYFTPWRLAQTVLTAGVSALVWPVLFTPPAAIYRSLTVGGASAADVFS